MFASDYPETAPAPEQPTLVCWRLLQACFLLLICWVLRRLIQLTPHPTGGGKHLRRLSQGIYPFARQRLASTLGLHPENEPANTSTTRFPPYTRLTAVLFTLTTLPPVLVISLHHFLCTLYTNIHLAIQQTTGGDNSTITDAITTPPTDLFARYYSPLSHWPVDGRLDVYVTAYSGRMFKTCWMWCTWLGARLAGVMFSGVEGEAEVGLDVVGHGMHYSVVEEEEGDMDLDLGIVVEEEFGLFEAGGWEDEVDDRPLGFRAQFVEEMRGWGVDWERGEIGWVLWAVMGQVLWERFMDWVDLLWWEFDLFLLDALAVSCWAWLPFSPMFYEL